MRYLRWIWIRWRLKVGFRHSLLVRWFLIMLKIIRKLFKKSETSLVQKLYNELEFVEMSWENEISNVRKCLEILKIDIDNKEQIYLLYRYWKFLPATNNDVCLEILYEMVEIIKKIEWNRNKYRTKI